MAWSAAIIPWNFPLINACMKIAPALAAGNALVLKPSEMTPFSLAALALLSVEAGLPKGILNVVNGHGPHAGSAMVRHPLVRKISFTGSTATGARIMADAALGGREAGGDGAGREEPHRRLRRCSRSGRRLAQHPAGLHL